MNSDIPYTRLMRQSDAAKKIGRNRQYIYKLIHRKRIKSYNVGGVVMVDYGELEQYEWVKRNPE